MSAAPDLATEHVAVRAARLLSRPGAVIEAAPLGYAVRFGAGRRRRPMLTLDEAAFQALVRLVGLTPRARGGWSLALSASPPKPSPPPGCPGMIEGERVIEHPVLGREAFKANLGESPLVWLARRRDGKGRPWLTPVEVAAGERLREEFQQAGSVGRLTMNWDVRVDGGRGVGLDPAERARSTKERIAGALEAAGPGLREILEHVCLAGTALEAAERSLGLPRRAGKTVLKLALQRLVVHYRMG